jgi:hypothetical protein
MPQCHPAMEDSDITPGRKRQHPVEDTVQPYRLIGLSNEPGGRSDRTGDS